MKLSQTAVKLIIAILALSVLISGVAIVGFNNVNFCGGLAFGAFFSAFKIILTERSIEHTVNLNNEKSAEAYARAQYALRYFITGGVLISAALIDSVNLYGAIVGVLLAQPAGYIVMFLEGRQATITNTNFETDSDSEESI